MTGRSAVQTAPDRLPDVVSMLSHDVEQSQCIGPREAGDGRVRGVRVLAAAVGTAVMVLASSCGANDTPTPSSTGESTGQLPGEARVDARDLPRLGTILVDGQGHTLYMFVPDHRKKVSCTGRCAGAWPPLTVVKNVKPTAGKGVDRSLLDTLPDPQDPMLRVITYNGWPLYGYAEDSEPGDTNGQGLNADGGYWYVLRPSGSTVKGPSR